MGAHDITNELLRRYEEGQLDEAQTADVEAAVARDPQLRRRLKQVQLDLLTPGPRRSSPARELVSQLKERSTASRLWGFRPSQADAMQCLAERGRVEGIVEYVTRSRGLPTIHQFLAQLEIVDRQPLTLRLVAEQWPPTWQLYHLMFLEVPRPHRAAFPAREFQLPKSLRARVVKPSPKTKETGLRAQLDSTCRVAADDARVQGPTRIKLDSDDIRAALNPVEFRADVPDAIISELTCTLPDGTDFHQTGTDVRRFSLLGLPVVPGWSAGPLRLRCQLVDGRPLRSRVVERQRSPGVRNPRETTAAVGPSGEAAEPDAFHPQRLAEAATRLGEFVSLGSPTGHSKRTAEVSVSERVN